LEISNLESGNPVTVLGLATEFLFPWKERLAGRKDPDSPL